MAEFPANLVRSAFSRFAFSGFGGQKVAKNFAVPPRFKVADADTDQAERSLLDHAVKQGSGHRIDPVSELRRIIKAGSAA